MAKSSSLTKQLEFKPAGPYGKFIKGRTLKIFESFFEEKGVTGTFQIFKGELKGNTPGIKLVGYGDRTIRFTARSQDDDTANAYEVVPQTPLKADEVYQQLIDGEDKQTHQLDIRAKAKRQKPFKDLWREESKLSEAVTLLRNYTDDSGLLSTEKASDALGVFYHGELKEFPSEQLVANALASLTDREILKPWRNQSDVFEVCYQSPSSNGNGHHSPSPKEDSLSIESLNIEDELPLFLRKSKPVRTTKRKVGRPPKTPTGVKAPKRSLVPKSRSFLNVNTARRFSEILGAGAGEVVSRDELLSALQALAKELGETFEPDRISDLLRWLGGCKIVRGYGQKEKYGGKLVYARYTVQSSYVASKPDVQAKASETPVLDTNAEPVDPPAIQSNRRTRKSSDSRWVWTDVLMERFAKHLGYPIKLSVVSRGAILEALEKVAVETLGSMPTREYLSKAIFAVLIRTHKVAPSGTKRGNVFENYQVLFDVAKPVENAQASAPAKQPEVNDALIECLDPSKLDLWLIAEQAWMAMLEKAQKHDNKLYIEYRPGNVCIEKVMEAVEMSVEKDFERVQLYMIDNNFCGLKKRPAANIRLGGVDFEGYWISKERPKRLTTGPIKGPNQLKQPLPVATDVSDAITKIDKQIEEVNQKRDAEIEALTAKKQLLLEALEYSERLRAAQSILDELK